MITNLILTALGLGLFFCAARLIHWLKIIDAKLGIGNTHASNTVEELRSLRLASRARVGNASFGEAPNAGDPHLVRVGRTTKTRRVVAGGDASSDQHRNLTEQIGGADESD